MKKTSNRILAALLLLLICLLPLASCGDTPSSQTDDSTSEEVTTEIAAAAKEYLLIDAGDGSKLTVKRSDSSESGDPDVKAAMSIQKALLKYSADKPVSIASDWTKDGKQKSDTLEILVGFTNYEETLSVSGLLDYGGYALKAVGNKIVVLSYTESGYNKAASLLINLIERAVVKDESGKATVKLNADDLNIFGNNAKEYADIPKYRESGLLSCYSSGPECYEIIFPDTNTDEYNAYINKLKADGYTLYAEHEMNGNPFATLYNKEQILNVGYYAYEKKTRVISQPYDKDQLPTKAEDNKYTVVTTGKLLMLGVSHYDSSNTLKGNGLAIVIRLTDGRFIIVDGGFNWTNHINQMVSTLKDLSKDYSSKTGIKVAAWIITHAHGDHNGLFTSKYTSLKSNGITVERFIQSNLSSEELERSYASSYSGNFSDTQSEVKTTGYVQAAANALGSKIVYAHTGQVYCYANVTMEILYTIESYAPEICNALNTTSLIIKMTFKDEKTGNETVYMSTGDATGPAFQICSKMYGEYLKSDIVQVAHHGGTSWGTESGTIAAYKLMKPATVLYPAGEATYNKNSVESRNAVLLKTSTNPNFKEVFVAGWDGSVIALDLPYTVGTAQVSLTSDPTKK